MPNLHFSKFLAFMVFFIMIANPVSTQTIEPYQRFETQYTKLLQNHTTNLGVDYHSLQNNPEFEHLVKMLIELPNPQHLDRQSTMSYWINAYNLMTIKLITIHYPIDSITSLHFAGSSILGYLFKRSIWQTWDFKLHNQSYTLDFIEHQILRPRFNDFRIHAALVCAARSCPPLRNESYSASRLESQLNDQMRIWIQDPSKNHYDSKTNTLYLSSIFNWFYDDFFKTDVGSYQKPVDVLRPYFQKEIAKDLNHETSIKYKDYDWSLNNIKSN